MNKLSLLSVSLLLGLTTFSQDCKYDLDSYDKFTKMHKLEKEVKLNKADLLGDGYLNVTICKYDSLNFIRLEYTSQKNLSISTSDKFLFLLDNQQTVVAMPQKNYMSERRRSNPKQQIIEASYSFEDPASFETLKKQKIQSVRIYYNGEFHDHNVKDKFQENFQSAMKCF
ncbi:hypothetical protein QTN47_06765 [Danxiaibacter flavus]|uniref:Lipoprotein n=1 Tax=Danxiaibacter flavus TaxID=3049108 RepID=A0ABV3ZBE8_9BACT|nr:hypothetical protein QNM32_06765 [Chitinophagaceae bacterium DXS]